MKGIAICITLLFLTVFVSAATLQNSITIIGSYTNASALSLPFVPSSSDPAYNIIDLTPLLLVVLAVGAAWYIQENRKESQEDEED